MTRPRLGQVGNTPPQYALGYYQTADPGTPPNPAAIWYDTDDTPAVAPTEQFVPGLVSGADVSIASLTDITVATKDVADLVAGDIIVVDALFTILNNSGATRVYVVTLDFDARFDIEFTTPALAAHASNEWPTWVQAVLDIRSTSLAYCQARMDQAIAGLASGGDSTIAATHLAAHGWGSSASNLTGTTTCSLLVRSANATATQTARLHGMILRRLRP